MEQQFRDGSAGRKIGSDGTPQSSVMEHGSADCCAGGMLRSLPWASLFRMMRQDCNSPSHRFPHGDGLRNGPGGVILAVPCSPPAVNSLPVPGALRA